MKNNLRHVLIMIVITGFISGAFASTVYPGEVNLALGKKAIQSSTADPGDPQRAVDGNTDGNWYANSVTHTNNAAQQWWQVDLGNIQEISKIRIWNRTDSCGTYSCGQRLSKFYVLVSDKSFLSTNLQDTLNQSGVWNTYHEGVGGTPTQISVNRSGRFVRIQLAGADYLSLAEVEVMGTSAVRPTSTTLAAQSGDGLQPLSPPDDKVIISNFNSGGVQSGPTYTTAFIIKVPCWITYINNYHYFNNGKQPGTIALRHEDGTVYGPWQAQGAAGYGNVPNGYWVVRPNIEIKPGRYTVVDSDTSTWSYNSQSKGSGFVEIRGVKLAAQEAPAGFTATIKITCDDVFTLYLNGIAIGSGNYWAVAQTFNVQLRDGANLIAVESQNNGGPAGLIADFNSATIGSTVTDTSWKYSTSADSGWNTSVSFNDSTWVNAEEYGSYGSAPWGANVSGISSTSAKWIWSSSASDSKVYFRKIITVGPS